MKSVSDPRTREPRSSFFSCYRTKSSPVFSHEMFNMNSVFDTCEEDSELVSMIDSGAKILKGGHYKLSFTALMKSTGSVPLKVEIVRRRGLEENGE